jgi:hypothetical protein
MVKLRMQTPNCTDEIFAAHAAMSPNTVTKTVDGSGAIVRAIDVDNISKRNSKASAETIQAQY